MPKRNPVAGTWQLQDAKARFSEVFRLAREEGPQRITRHGREAVVVLPQEEYERLRTRKETAKPKTANLAEFFMNSPLRGLELEVERAPDLGRDLEL